MNQFHPLRVRSVAKQTRDAVVLTFDLSEEQRLTYKFAAGQYLTMRTFIAGDEQRRSYSICSAPHEQELRVAIKRVPGGAFSTWANSELQPGEFIDVMLPAGRFGTAALAVAGHRHHVGLAAGSGITPILSIMKSVLQGDPSSRFTLVYGNRASSSVLFKEELEDLKDRFVDRVNLVFILSREQQEIDLFNGRIDRARCDRLLEQWIDPETIDAAYICGPQSMMIDVKASLEAHGVSADRIEFELFGGARTVAPRAIEGLDAQSGTCLVDAIQDGRRRGFSIVREKQTVLEGALAQGFELPYSCKAGVCSTCRTKLTQGEVEMDVNFALEDYEVARGFILTCQSYALTDRIVLDYDQES